MADLQDRLYAQDRWAVLLVFQAIDAAGKDSAIKHVMSGGNPQGCQVFSFKSPSSEDLDHDYLWRCTKALPERRRIGIFNRSYYEEVVVVRVHPELFAGQRVPKELLTTKKLWNDRCRDIRHFESCLSRNGTPQRRYVVPADHTWLTRVVVAAAIVNGLAGLNLKYPAVAQTQSRDMARARQRLGVLSHFPRAETSHRNTAEMEGS